MRWYNAYLHDEMKLREWSRHCETLGYYWPGDNSTHTLQIVFGVSKLPASLLLLLFGALSKTRVIWTQALWYPDSQDDNLEGN